MTTEEQALMRHGFVGYRPGLGPDGLQEAFHICDCCWMAMQKRTVSAGCLSCRIEELELAYLGLRFACHMAHRALDNKLPNLARSILAEGLKDSQPKHLLEISEETGDE